MPSFSVSCPAVTRDPRFEHATVREECYVLLPFFRSPSSSPAIKSAHNVFLLTSLWSSFSPKSDPRIVCVPIPRLWRQANEEKERQQKVQKKTPDSHLDRKKGRRTGAEHRQESPLAETLEPKKRMCLVNTTGVVKGTLDALTAGKNRKEEGEEMVTSCKLM